MSSRLAAPLVFLASTLAVILTITPWPVGTYQDDAIYTVLAKSLAEGSGYRMLNLPGEPAGTHYPPGYPAFLALLWRLGPSFPDNIVLFKYANAALVGLGALGVRCWLRKRAALGELAASTGALLATCSVVVLLTAGVLMSEPLFVALLIPSLSMAEEAAEHGRMRDAALAGALVGLLALVRTLGVALLPAMVVVMLWRRRWTSAVVATLVTLAFLVPWQLWVEAHGAEIPEVLSGKYGPYLSWMIDGYREGGLAIVAEIVVVNVRDTLFLFSSLVLPVGATAARVPGAVLALVVLATGCVALARRAPVLLAFLAIYGAIVLLWPFEPSRFLVGVWAAFVLVAVSGTAWLARWSPSGTRARTLRWSGLACAGLACLGHVVYSARGVQGRWWEASQREAGRRGLALAEWARERTAPGDVLVTPDELIVYLYGGRQALPVSTFRPRERLRRLTDDEVRSALAGLLDAYEPRWFLSSRPQDLLAADALAAAQPPRLRRADRLRNVVIYDVIPVSGSSRAPTMPSRSTSADP